MRIYSLKAIGDELKKRRAALALTQGDAARLTGVSQRLWSECERGERLNVSFDTILRMLHTLDLDIDLVHRGATSESHHSALPPAGPTP